MNLPVLLIIFNRHKNTKIVLNALREAKVKNLYISADGPRPHKPNDKDDCQKTRNLINDIDWDCNITTRLIDNNLGCKNNVIASINWFFDHVEYGAILEDDCVPSPSFFIFCENMLEKYKNNHKVFHISGSNFVESKLSIKESFYFSAFTEVWGWATWKRAWLKLDRKMINYPLFLEDKKLELNYQNKTAAKWMKGYMDDVYSGASNIWSPIWEYTIINNNGVSITPKTNLVRNIGFEGEATSDPRTYKIYSTFMANTLDCSNLIYPENFKINKTADSLRFKLIKKTDPKLLRSVILRSKIYDCLVTFKLISIYRFFKKYILITGRHK